MDAAIARMSWITLLSSLLALACVGGQSGAEGTENRQPSGGWEPPGGGPGAGCAPVPDDFFDFDHEAAARALEGRHRTTLGWLPIDPFDGRRSIEAVLEIEPRGKVRRGRECIGPTIEVVATLELPDSRRRATFTGGAYLREGGGNVIAQSGRDVTAALADPGAALRGEGDELFHLHAQLRGGVLTGGMLEGHNEPGCESARLPAEPTACPYDSEQIEWDTEIGGFAIDDALADLQALGAQALVAPGDGSQKAVEVTFAKGEGPVCAGPFFRLSGRSEQIHAPVLVRVQTEDGMLEHEFGAMLSAVGSHDTGVARIEADPVANGAQLTGRALLVADDLSVLQIDLKPAPEGTRGTISLNAAERLVGWPELDLPRGSKAVAISWNGACTGIRERGRMWEANVDTVPVAGE